MAMLFMPSQAAAGQRGRPAFIHSLRRMTYGATGEAAAFWVRPLEGAMHAPVCPHRVRRRALPGRRRPLPLTAQHRNALTAGVTTAARASEGRELAKSGQRPSPPIWPDADSTAKKLSLGRHVLVGASIGMVAALAIVTYGQ